MYLGLARNVGCPLAYTTKTVKYNLEQEESWYQKAQKKKPDLQVGIELTTLPVLVRML